MLIYAKNKEKWRPYLLSRTQQMNDLYKNPDNDSRGVWMSDNLSVKTYSASTDYAVTTPTGRIVKPPESRCWSVSKEKFKTLVEDNRIWFGKDGDGMPRLKRFLSEVKEGMVSKTIWYRTDVGDNQESKREIKLLFGNDVFSTPKPERLLRRILELSTNSGDWILDSFLGSGTTAAVAHKIGRKYIGIEFGEHANTHCLPRLKKVVDGTDGLALSETLGWKGGGGFKFYNLAPSLLRKDTYGNWVIDERYNADMLAAAMAKHEGFTYAPDQTLYWKQGQSTEKDFIFTTTNFLTVEMLDKIHSEMRPDESLLICCKAFSKACENRHSSITVKKIPNMLLGRCEFGKDNYNLRIIDMPQEDTAHEG